MEFTLQPAEGDNFIDRKELLQEVITDLKNKKSNTGFALYGIRRIGKTSILKEIMRRLEREKEVVVVYFSVWDLVEFSVTEFCQKLSMEIIDAFRPRLGLKYKTKELLQTPLNMLREILDKAEFKIVYKEIEFMLSVKKEVDNNLLIENTFSIPEKFAKETNTKCILLLDEFPSLMELKGNGSQIGESILKKIRSIFENWKRTSLIISGSIRNTIRLAVLSPASPFYRQLIIKEVKPLDKRDVKELLLRNINLPGDAIDEIYNFSAGIPFYVQFIGKILGKKEVIIKKDIKNTEEKFLEEEGNILFKEEFESLSPNEKLIILAISKGNNQSAEITKILKDKISNVSRFLTYLEEKGYVSKKEKGFYVIDDPVFERWLRQKY